MATPSYPVSVLILTRNEEVNIRACLESLRFSDDITVYDSFSDDRTLEIAREFPNVSIVQRTFDDWSSHQNWAVKNIRFKHPWVLYIDADERVEPELADELGRVADPASPVAAYTMRRRDYFLGRWLRRSQMYPTWLTRLFRPSRIHYERLVNPVAIVEGPTERLRGHLVHYPFSKGVVQWIDRHNSYSTFEARELIKVIDGKRRHLRALFSADPVERRAYMKELFYRLPARPQIKWIYFMLWRMAWWDGVPGIVYVRLLCMYEQMITIKSREILSVRRAGGHVPGVPSLPPELAAAVLPQAAPPRPPVPTVPAPRPPEAAPGPAEAPTDAGQMIPASSPWTFREKVFRAVWMVVGRPIFRLSFHNWYGFRASLLRLFGAKVGRGTRLRPTVNVEIPWNLDIRDGVTVGDHAILYSLGTITIGERTIVSQYAHLCAGTHDHNDRRFPLIRDPITIGSDAWIGADAFVGPNVTIGRLSVLGARSSAYRSLSPETVYVGNPARALKRRELR